MNCDLRAGTIEICNETYDPVVQGQDPRWNSFDKDWTILNPFNILRQVISPAVCSQFCCGELVVYWYSINSILKRLRILSRSHLPHLSSSSYKISCFPSLSLNDLAFQLPLDSHCTHLRGQEKLMNITKSMSPWNLSHAQPSAIQTLAAWLCLCPRQPVFSAQSQTLQIRSHWSEQGSHNLRTVVSKRIISQNFPKFRKMSLFTVVCFG